jgi:deaminated glutathione amidase
MPNPPVTTRVAAIQLCATPDVEANLAQAERLVGEACERGARVVFLPEAFAYLGPERDKQALLETLPEPDATTGAGPILTRCRNLARQAAVDLILGGFHERAVEPGKSYNTCLHLDAGGNIAARYRKIHLFDVSLADGTELRESANTLPGDRVVTTDLPFGRLGLTVCYDVRFPYLFQALADRGATAITVASAFTRPTGAAHWHVLLRARAIESQCYVIAPAQHGHNWGRRTSYGHSLIIDPWGEVLAELEDGDGVIIADIDPERVASVRAQLPSLTHRRALD